MGNLFEIGVCWERGKTVVPVQLIAQYFVIFGYIINVAHWEGGYPGCCGEEGPGLGMGLQRIRNG